MEKYTVIYRYPKFDKKNNLRWVYQSTPNHYKTLEDAKEAAEFFNNYGGKFIPATVTFNKEY